MLRTFFLCLQLKATLLPALQSHVQQISSWELKAYIYAFEAKSMWQLWCRHSKSPLSHDLLRGQATLWSAVSQQGGSGQRCGLGRRQLFEVKSIKGCRKYTDVSPDKVSIVFFQEENTPNHSVPPCGLTWYSPWRALCRPPAAASSCTRPSSRPPAQACARRTETTLKWLRK